MNRPHRSAGPGPRHRPKTIPPRARPILRATELGSARALKAGSAVLLSDPSGDVAPDRRGLGLYRDDTRILSTAVLLVQGRSGTLLRPDPGGASAGVVLLTNPDLPGDPTRAIDHPVALPRESIGIRRARRLEPTGVLHEHVTVANFTEAPQRVRLELVLDADGADIFEVRGSVRPRRGELAPIEVDTGRVRFRYRAVDGLELLTVVALDPAPDALGAAPPEAPGSVIASWALSIAPGDRGEVAWVVRGGWQQPGRPESIAAREDAAAARSGTTHDAVAVVMPAAAPMDDLAPPSAGVPAASVEAPPAGSPVAGVDPLGAGEPGGLGGTGTTFETDDELVDLILQRAIADLHLLRSPGPGPGERHLAAGIPWFATLFGRDSLIAGFAALPYLPDLARDALTVLGRLQAVEDDPDRDAEPGKILHELRRGEMARTGELPFGHYYGSVDATPLWLILLAETVAWTGDRGIVDELWPTVLRALDWLRDSPRDEDGFLTYRTRSTRGLRNQGWKDSSDAIRDRDGRLLEPPIALAEVQAYAVDARRRTAELARARGERSLAKDLDAEAATLAERLDARFWRHDVGRYAMALGPGGTVGDAVASNVGHCLWAGALPVQRAPLAAQALVSPPLFSGWGVRTYGADQPGFNPLGYHTGSVWPHDSAIAAAGLKRYGFHEEATTLAWSVLDAARRVPGFRLPELFCGFDRAATDAPVVHPVACAPQAWAAAAALMLVTTMLGLQAHAPDRLLEVVRPVLPRELPKVVVRGIAIGDATLDLLFHRWRGTTSVEVIGRSGDVRVTVRL